MESSSDRLTVIGIIVGSLLAVAAMAQAFVIWSYDRQPELTYVSNSFRQEGRFTYITVQNKPGTGSAVVTGMYFFVTDPKMIQSIQAVQEAPPPIKTNSGTTGAPIDVDEALFQHGEWDEQGRYVLEARVSYYVEPGKPTKLKLGLAGREWQDKQLVGTLMFEYGGEKPFQLNQVVMYGP